MAKARRQKREAKQEGESNPPSSTTSRNVSDVQHGGDENWTEKKLNQKRKVASTQWYLRFSRYETFVSSHSHFHPLLSPVPDGNIQVWGLFANPPGARQTGVPESGSSPLFPQQFLQFPQVVFYLCYYLVSCMYHLTIPFALTLHSWSKHGAGCSAEQTQNVAPAWHKDPLLFWGSEGRSQGITHNKQQCLDHQKIYVP